MNQLGLYLPGDSWLHRAPAAFKLSAMVLIAIATVVLRRWMPLSLALLVAVALTYPSAGISLKTLFRQVRPVLVMTAFIAALHLLTRDWHLAVVVPAAIFTLVLLAALVTLTTRTTDLVDVIVRLARPLTRFGVEPERVGLTLLLGIRCVPLISALAGQVREAQLARSGSFDITTFAVPLIVAAIREADSLGEALTARGFDD
ncbi:MAG: energy-coupling factor transporter transmembrane protein EcfT [Propionibacteriaceae bacterium]|jgi:biotin transport system permease protein|nr:energy-coupling factor transporter transmembrane protein EcfT [Propionibacteriaceae bacterium]